MNTKWVDIDLKDLSILIPWLCIFMMESWIFFFSTVSTKLEKKNDSKLVKFLVQIYWLKTSWVNVWL